MSTTDQIPENTSTTYTLTAGQSNTSTIDPADVSGGVDHDWYKVTLTGGHSYTFSASINSGNLGTVAIDLRDSSGALIANTLTDSTAPSFNYMPSASGTFYLAISAGGSDLASQQGSYTVNLKDNGVSTTDQIPENTSTTYTLTAGQSNTSTIDPADVSGGVDHDWYKVTLTGGHSYTFSASINSGNLGTVAIDLRDSSGALIANTLTDSTAPSFNYMPGASGTFYLAISAGGSDLTSQQGSYTVNLRDNGVSTTDQIPENTSTTYTLTAGQSNTSTIDPADVSGGVDHDWYKVTLTGGHSYTFSASINSGNLGTVAIDLRDSSGALIANTLTDSTAPSFNYMPGASGTFYLAISAGGSDLASQQGSYTVNLKDNGVSSGGSVDPYIAYNDPTPADLTPSDVAAAATQYVGSLWASDNCTGLVWAVSVAVGAPFYETISTATDGQSTSASQLTTVPDPTNGFIVPPTAPEAGSATAWQTLPATSNWQSIVQIGDVVRIPSGVLAGSPAGHSFIVVGQNSQGQWLVIDNTDPNHVAGSGSGPITISEHTFDTANTFYSQILGASTAYVSRLAQGGGGDTISGIDYRRNTGKNTALDGVSVATIKTDGYGFVGEYIGNAQNNGYLTSADAQTFPQGVSIVSIYERTPTSVSYFTGTTNGIANSDYDASGAVKAAQQVAGQPLGTAIYFTIDYDPSNSSDFAAIDSYFQEIRSDLTSLGSPYKLGIYGPGDVLSVLANDPLVHPDYTWLDSYAWPANGFTGENIKRIQNAVPASPTSLGFNVDLDTALVSDFGGWNSSSSNSDDTVGESAPSSISAISGQAFAFTGANAVQVVDDGLNGETFAAVITANAGILSASGTGVSGSGTTSVSITGTLSQVNAALGTLTYLDSTAGSDSVSVTTSDLADQTSANKTIAVTVNSATTLFNFKFTYADGSYYVGTVADDGTYGYHVGETINGTTAGSYSIVSSAGTTSEAAGTVTDTSYFDTVSQKTYTPYYLGFASYGYYSGTNGLNQDSDYVVAGGLYYLFGAGGADEAKVGPVTTLYNFKFTYADGSYYVGTVADSGTYGYHVGETINGTTGGSYSILSSAGTTSQASGTVTDTSYFDTISQKTYTPYYLGFASYGYHSGTNGLNHDFDYVVAGGLYYAFGGGGADEAKVGPVTALYNFKFTYADGSYYIGTVADSGTYGYHVGETINGTTGGSYSILSSAGTTSQASGTVTDTSYFDVTSQKTYTPYYLGFASYGYHSGANGLNQDFDYVFTGGHYYAFGGGGADEAEVAPPTTTLFDFKFTYADGSYYTGTVADNGTYGYHVGETINGTTNGSYSIYASAGASSEASGIVFDNSYFDATSQKTYTPVYEVYASAGYKSGASGLNQDYDYVLTAGQYYLFGGGGADEAKIAPATATLYNFKFTYVDGSDYIGTVADNGTYGYHVGETINGTSGGSYSIYASAGTTSEASGTVIDTSYFDATSQKTYTPYYLGFVSYGYYSGTNGLNQDFDYILAGGQFHAFGGGGADEAKITSPTGSAAGNNANGQASGQGIDLPDIRFDAQTTLAYSPDKNDAGSIVVSDGTHQSTITLLAQYAAADLQIASDFHGGTLVSDPTLSGAALSTFLASSHT